MTLLIAFRQLYVTHITLIEGGNFARDSVQSGFESRCQGETPAVGCLYHLRAGRLRQRGSKVLVASFLGEGL